MLQNNLEIEDHDEYGKHVYYNDGTTRTLLGLLESVKIYTEKGVEKTQLVFRGHPVQCVEKRSELLLKAFETLYGKQLKISTKKPPRKKPNAKTKKS